MNRLYGSRVYQAGPIEGAKDFGYIWRNETTPILQSMGIVVLNPLKKPLLEWQESNECMKLRKEWRSKKQYDKICSLNRIRNTDLRLVDISDFLLIYLDMEAKPCGTMEEMFLANRQKKACITVVEGGYDCTPDWLFWTIPFEFIHENFNSAIEYIKDINEGKKDHKRFVHFDFTKLQPK